MPINFISEERAFSSVKGVGVQYIPGHKEEFVDLILTTYLPSDGEILELGGGGLRFALPVAETRSITVVDLDKESLNIIEISRKVEKNNKKATDLDAAMRRIKPVVSDALTYLSGSNECYSLIASFRLLHFFSTEELESFFELSRRKLKENGLLVFSGFGFYELPIKDRFNLLYINSVPVLESQYLRNIEDSEKGLLLRKEQNLGKRIHCFDLKLVSYFAQKYGFDIVLAGFPSTKIVEGYILRAV